MSWPASRSGWWHYRWRVRYQFRNGCGGRAGHGRRGGGGGCGVRRKVVIIRLYQLGMLDATGAHTLAEIAEDLESRGITVIIKGVQPEHRDLLTNIGVFESLRHEHHLIDSLDDAIAHARSHTQPVPALGQR